MWTGPQAIVMSEADGSGQRVIVFNAPTVTQPATFDSPDLSPDETKVAMGSSSGGLLHSSRIYVAGTDGTARGLAPLDQSGAAEYSPRWSPDGRKIAYHEWNATSQNYDIAIANSDGSNPRVVAAGGQMPSWSPDGRRLVFVSSPTNGGGGVTVVNVDGTNRRTLAPASGSRALWSPDGTRIAFQQVSGGSVTVMNSDGTSRHTVVQTPGYLQDWDPDSRRLLEEVGSQMGQAPFAIEILDGSFGTKLETIAADAVAQDASWQRP